MMFTFLQERLIISEWANKIHVYRCCRTAIFESFLTYFNCHFFFLLVTNISMLVDLLFLSVSCLFYLLNISSLSPWRKVEKRYCGVSETMHIAAAFGRNYF